MMSMETLSISFEKEIHDEIKSLETKLSSLNTNSEILMIIVSLITLYIASTSEKLLEYWNVSFFTLFVLWTLYAFLRPRKEQNTESQDVTENMPEELRLYLFRAWYGINFEAFFKAFGLLFLVSAFIGFYNAITKYKITQLAIMGILFLVISGLTLLYISEEYFSTVFLQIQDITATLIKPQKTSASSRPKTTFKKLMRIIRIIQISLVLIVAFVIYKIFFPSVFKGNTEIYFWIFQFAAIQYLLSFSLATYFRKLTMRRNVLNALFSLRDYLVDPQVHEFTYEKFMETIKFTNFRQGTFLFAIEYYLSCPHPRYVKWLKQQSTSPQERQTD